MIKDLISVPPVLIGCIVIVILRSIIAILNYLLTSTTKIVESIIMWTLE